MATTLTSEPVQEQTQATAEEIFARVSVREQKLSRLLVFYISGGLLFTPSHRKGLVCVLKRHHDGVHFSVTCH
jgi:hypothetical protein